MQLLHCMSGITISPSQVLPSQPLEIHSFPSEMLLEIVFRLAIENISFLIPFSQVCKKWNLLANHAEILALFYRKCLGREPPKEHPGLKSLSAAFYLQHIQELQFKKISDRILGIGGFPVFATSLFTNNKVLLTTLSVHSRRESRKYPLHILDETGEVTSKGVVLPGSTGRFLYSSYKSQPWLIKKIDSLDWAITDQLDLQAALPNDLWLTLENEELAALLIRDERLFIVTKNGMLLFFNQASESLHFEKYQNLKENDFKLEHHFLIDQCLILGFEGKVSNLFKIYDLDTQSWDTQEELKSKLHDYIPHTNKYYGINKKFINGKAWKFPSTLYSKTYCDVHNSYCLWNECSTGGSISQGHLHLFHMKDGKELWSSYGSSKAYLIEHPLLGPLVFGITDALRSSHDIEIYQPLIKLSKYIHVDFEIMDVAFSEDRLYVIDAKRCMHALSFISSEVEPETKNVEVLEPVIQPENSYLGWISSIIVQVWNKMTPY